jgi:hypothetical protein
MLRSQNNKMKTRSTGKRSKALEKDGLKFGDNRLAAVADAYLKFYGERAFRIKDLAIFEFQHPELCQPIDGQLSSGAVARHDPERMARAQRAGYVYIAMRDASMWVVSESIHKFIMEILAMVRDGKLV